MNCTLTPQQIIRRLYAWKRGPLAGRMTPAHEALREARHYYAVEPAKATARVRYASGDLRIWRKAGGANGAPNVHGERWIEAPTLRGLRDVGTAHGLKIVNHEGWFTDRDFQDETVHGVVYRLPARRGRARFLGGMADPHNEDGALLDMEIFESEPRGTTATQYGRTWALDTDAREACAIRDAAQRGDHIAQRYAEAECEYQDAFRAGQAAREKMNAARKIGRRWLRLARAARNAFATRRARAHLGIPLAETLAAFRTAKAALRDACDDYREARETAHSAIRDALDMHADAAREGYGAMF